MELRTRGGPDPLQLVAILLGMVLLVVISFFVLQAGLRGKSIFGSTFERHGMVDVTTPAHASAEATLGKSDKLK